MLKRNDDNGKNAALLQDAIYDYTMRAKTLISELNSQLGLDNPESSVIVNPFATENTSFMSSDMSLNGQLTSFLNKGYGFWCSIFHNEYKGQTIDNFVPTAPMMYTFWSHPSLVGNYPNLSVIALHVSHY